MPQLITLPHFRCDVPCFLFKFNFHKFQTSNTPVFIRVFALLLLHCLIMVARETGAIKKKKPPTFHHFPVNRGIYIYRDHPFSLTGDHSKKVEKDLGGNQKDQEQMES